MNGLFPSVILFINTDLTTNVKNMLVRQLHINEVIDGYTFDQRIAAQSTYPDVIHQLNLRLMVMRDLSDQTNRSLADVVLFFSHGLICVEASKVGPPGLTLPVVNLYWGALGFF